MQHQNDWIIIGISGVTCGGKTTLANQLKERINPAYVFHQDKYFFPDDSPQHVRCANLDHNNYDILSAVDMNSMYSDICATLKGTNKAHAVVEEGGFKIPNRKFMIIEGFTVLNFEPIVKLCDLKYYFVLEYGECLARRVYRVYDPPDIPGYFEQCVWPEHVKYRAQAENDPRIAILDGTAHNALTIVMADLAVLRDRLSTLPSS